MDDEKNKKPDIDESEKREKHEKQEKKGRSIASRLGDYRGEYKKIIWPTRQDLVKETMVVIVVCLMLGAIISAFDTAFAAGYNLLISFLG